MNDIADPEQTPNLAADDSSHGGATVPVYSMADWQAKLSETFTRIQHTRMAGVPVIHPDIQVNADYFVPWGDDYLGVLITPWFMNLVLLPGNEERAALVNARRIGSKLTHIFPSGGYEFIVAHEESLGCYQSCSLFSPMFDFQDQAAALDTAVHVLQELMNADNEEILDRPPAEGDEEARALDQHAKSSSDAPAPESTADAPPANADSQVSAAAQPTSDTLKNTADDAARQSDAKATSKVVSRRQLLTGLRR